MDLMSMGTSDQHKQSKLWQTRKKHLSESCNQNNVLLSKQVSYEDIHQALQWNILSYICTRLIECLNGQMLLPYVPPLIYRRLSAFINDEGLATLPIREQYLFSFIGDHWQ